MAYIYPTFFLLQCRRNKRDKTLKPHLHHLDKTHLKLAAQKDNGKAVHPTIRLYHRSAGITKHTLEPRRIDIDPAIWFVGSYKCLRDILQCCGLLLQSQQACNTVCKPCTAHP
eukprot:GHUV01024304.1.p3 GENE.GHUV01024304.1~~GHUV01024304.1.p3  ORF type:complete len:113 (-),score=5.48 GHUV01024304.1:782-1120(-)